MKQQEKWIIDMATYAAMIEIMDDGIGKIIEKLKAKGMYDNSVFIFLSDNGSTQESGYIKQWMVDLSNTLLEITNVGLIMVEQLRP